jgi:hypothetical protein
MICVSNRPLTKRHCASGSQVTSIWINLFRPPPYEPIRSVMLPPARPLLADYGTAVRASKEITPSSAISATTAAFPGADSTGGRRTQLRSCAVCVAWTSGCCAQPGSAWHYFPRTAARRTLVEALKPRGTLRAFVGTVSQPIDLIGNTSTPALICSSMPQYCCTRAATTSAPHTNVKRTRPQGSLARGGGDPRF